MVWEIFKPWYALRNILLQLVSSSLRTYDLPRWEHVGRVAHNWPIIKLRTNIGKVLPRSCQEHKHTGLVYLVGGPGTDVRAYVYTVLYIHNGRMV